MINTQEKKIKQAKGIGYVGGKSVFSLEWPEKAQEMSLSRVLTKLKERHSDIQERALQAKERANAKALTWEMPGKFKEQ